MNMLTETGRYVFSVLASHVKDQRSLKNTTERLWIETIIDWFFTVDDSFNKFPVLDLKKSNKNKLIFNGTCIPVNKNDEPLCPLEYTVIVKPDLEQVIDVKVYFTGDPVIKKKILYNSYYNIRREIEVAFRSFLLETISYADLIKMVKDVNLAK